MAQKDVKFFGNLGLHGSLRFLETNADFPASPSIGDVVLKGTELFAYVKIGDFETWYPFANSTRAFIHTQGVAQTIWTVTHNLGTTDIWTQIRDSNNDIVYASIENITANSFQLVFTEAVTGTVIVVAPDSISVPAVTTSMIQVGNVEITGSNITINGQAVLTGGSFATVATSGLFADLLSKPTTLAGYNISDAQPLDADLSAIAALNTTGFLKRTGADTWALDNSTYITGNQSITISGDASGSGTTSIALTLANSGVTAGDYTKVTVNGKGIVTSGSNPTTLAGYNISDAAPLSHVGSGGSAHAAATTSTSGFMSATDKTKLDGIGAGANVTSVAGKTGVVTLDNSDVGLGNVENKSSATIRSELTSGNVTTALGFTPENAANKNAVNGYAGLDANSKISAAQLPAIAITNTFVVASQVAQLALTAETGDVAVRTDLNKSFILQGTDPSVLGDWQELLTPTDLVQSVNGMTGTVTVSTISGNAGTATTLQTARTLWGQSFDGSANVSGNMTSVGSISASSTISTSAAGVSTDSFNAVGATTERRIIRLGNTGGDAIFGIDDNAGGTTIVGASAYDAIVRGASGIAFSANAGTALQARLTSAGNFLVGTGTLSSVVWSGDNTTLEVKGASANKVGILKATSFGTGNLTSVELFASDSTNQCGVITATNTPFDVYTNGSFAARFSTGQRFLVGTTTDNGTDKLQVAGSALFSGSTQIMAYLLTSNTGSYLRFGNSGATAGYIGYNSSGDLDFQTSATTRMTISSAGAFTLAGTTKVYNASTDAVFRIDSVSARAFTEYQLNSTAKAFIGVGSAANDLIQGSSIGSLSLRTQGTSMLFSTDSGVTANAAISASGNILINTPTDNGVDKLQINGTSYFSSNIGIGAALLGWNSGYKALQILNSAFFATASNDTNLGSNVYVNSGGNYTYAANGQSAIYTQFLGDHIFGIAASGTAGNTVTFTNAMTLKNSGNLLIGTTIDYSGKLNAKVNTDTVFRITTSAGVGSTGEGTALDVVNAAGTDVQPLLLRASLITFRNIGGEVARFAPTSGNLLLGTTTDGAKLRVVSANSGEYATEIINNGSTGANGLYVNIGASATGNVVRFDKNSSAALIVNNSGNTLVGTTVDASTRLYVRGVDQTSSNYAFVAADSNGNAGLAVRNDRHVLVHELLLVGGVSNDATHTLQVAGPLSVSNAGVDASLATAYTAYYNSNYTEKNVIQTSVSSTASSSGWYFRVSDGGGSGATTGIMSINRDAVRPMTDNVYNLGSGSNRWATIYAGTGTINTSDAREKTTVSSMTSDELNAAKQLAKEIGSFKFLSAIAAKGDDARKHIGMTVQRAIEIMELNNLNPFAYGFICYDQWNEKIEDGEVVLAAGDRYSFRTDELALFIARGQEERLSILEALAAQHLV